MGMFVNKYENALVPEERVSKEELKETNFLIKDARKGNTTKFSELRK